MGEKRRKRESGRMAGWLPDGWMDRARTVFVWISEPWGTRYLVVAFDLHSEGRGHFLLGGFLWYRTFNISDWFNMCNVLISCGLFNPRARIVYFVSFVLV